MQKIVRNKCIYISVQDKGLIAENAETQVLSFSFGFMSGFSGNGMTIVYCGKSKFSEQVLYRD